MAKYQVRNKLLYLIGTGINIAFLCEDTHRGEDWKGDAD